ncbi:MAG: dockerin type I domain-containing protein [Euryarchaeota archaeon]|nr:dockerin type I domain-containing protein [Euryarchaeota archaeon]
MLAILMLAAAAVFMSCTYVNPASATFVPDNGTLLGVTYNPAMSEQDIEDLRSFEEWSGKKHSIVVVFQGFSPDELSPLPETQMDNLWQNGNTPLLSIEPWGSDDDDILGVINNGTLDQYLKDYAKDLKNWTCGDWIVDGRTGTGKQVFIRFAHEMNLNSGAYPWCNRSPASYTDAWKRVYSIFESEGPAPDAIQWVWCVNSVDVPDRSAGGYGAEEYYPGGEYVDWVAIDGYNVGKSVPCADWDHWTAFDGIFKPMLDRFDNHQNISKKPYAIIEIGSSSVVDSMPVKEFNVYTNNGSRTNHYIPSGWWGDWGDITFCDYDRLDPHLGIACGDTSVKLTYSAERSQEGVGWGGICWQEGGYNLTGADNLTFWARGESGGEKIEFTAGDIDASTGTITLTNIWQRYIVDDLTGGDLSNVVCGFYWGASEANNPDGCTIYLDDIRYESSIGIEDVCVEEGVSNNTTKEKWVKETYDSIKNHPRIKMVCYFNVDKGGTKYLTGESDWAVFTMPRDNRNNIDDCSFDPNKRVQGYQEAIGDDHYLYRFPIPAAPKGDLNGDNRITPADAAIAIAIAVSGAQNSAADVSGDDRVTSLDALMILQTAAENAEL